MGRHILAIDQGTTSTRAIVFDATTAVRGVAQREFPQHYPQAGWVEHDVEDIWRDTLACARAAMAEAGTEAADIAGIGITNQRETVVIWERASGKPIHNAIVWQDRRTASACQALKAQGHEALFRARTGLLLDPYFSGTTVAWLLDNVPGARAAAEAGQLAMGTIDCFLLWRLTGGKVHATDITNASRTLLYDIHKMAWDAELCATLGVPMALLPDVRDNSGLFGHTEPGLLGAAIPIAGMAGDQQAALFGQACFAPGMAKSTYGTGCFMLMNTGAQAPLSQNRLLTTPAYRLNGQVTYALEGSIFVAGAAVKWLRDGLGVIVHASDTTGLAQSVPDAHGVYMVPAFVGLGAPHWDPDARGAIYGLTLDAGPAHLARAALEAVGYQSLDLLDAMARDSGTVPAAIRVDGGMTANDWLCQFLADMFDVPVERPGNLETTALGAAFLAGLATGVWSGLEEVAAVWARRDAFVPQMARARRSALVAGWHDALGRTLSKPA